MPQRHLPDLLAFIVGLGAAYLYDWKAGDLIWSLWISSLTIGYATILITVSSAYVGALRHGPPPGEDGTVARLAIGIGGLVLGAFFIGFFSIHFGGFHFVHSMFLLQFFPPPLLEGRTLADLMRQSEFAWWPGLVLSLVPAYWPMLVATLLSERDALLEPWRKALAPIEDGPRRRNISDFLREAGLGKSRGFKNGDPMFRPYINVIRMHILIFFFAGAAAAKADNFLVFAVVYVVYFFPWSALRGQKHAEEPS